MRDAALCRVLLVEDEAGDAHLVQQALCAARGARYEVDWVIDLAQAKQRLHEAPHDLLLLDLSLPDSSGMNTVREIHRTARSIPIIVLTGNDDFDLALQTLEAGAQDYLVKGSFDSDGLTRAIRYAISRASLEQRLIESEAHLRTVSDYTYDWEYWVGPQGDIRYMSPSCERVSGYTREEFVADAKLLHRIVHVDDRERMAIHYREVSKEEIGDIDFRIVRRDGAVRWIAHACTPVRGVDGQYDGRRVSNRDITERKCLEAELRELSITDTLTNLPNRRQFFSSLDDELARVKRLGTQRTSVLMLDLDLFKRVNDDYGHFTGDSVLRHFSRLMREELRKIDTGARVGGEEFAIILPGADKAAARAFADRLRQKVAATPLRQDGREIAVTVSIGISDLRAEDGNGDAVLARADEALYRAKRAGRNRVEMAA